MRPRRNLAILAVLYYTGLRVSEVLALRRAQYDGVALRNVVRKGGLEAQKLLLHPDCVEFLEQCLAKERPLDAAGEESQGAGKLPLFMAARTGCALDRPRVGAMLKRLADEAHARGHVQERFAPHPHQIRHTFGAKYREASGSDTETAAALGHAGIRHVGRYVRKTDAERAGLLREALEL